MNRETPAIKLLVLGAISLLLFLSASGVRGDDEWPSLRHVFVPVNQSELWPKGDWLAVPFAEYEELYQATRRSVAQRSGADIEWQSLSASFDPARGVLTDGRWTAEVRGVASKQRLMSLEPLDLAISELRWADGEATWGTDSDGNIQLLVDAAARRLEGRFSRQGRRLQRTWQFPLRLAKASVTELKIRVPAKYSLKCDEGHLRGPLASGEEAWRLWQINLSGQSRCEVLVMETPAIAPTEPVVVYEQTSAYVLREAEVEIQHEVQAEIFHTPKTSLTFTIPDDLTIYSVGFAADSRLNWHELPRTPERPRQIEVQLPEPQIGKVRAIQILAGMTAKWEPSWALPRIQLSGGWFVGGRWNVAVDSPLVWRALTPTGLRLTSVDASVSDVRRLSFLQYLADASLMLDIAYPEPRLSVKGLQNLSVANNEWRLATEWHWQGQSGGTFSVRCRIPSGWEILDVRSIGDVPITGVRHWDVVSEMNGDRTLVIEFAQPLARGVVQRVRVDARKIRHAVDDRETFELPTPQANLNAEHLLVVNVPDGWQWDSIEAGRSASLAVKQITEPWTQFDLWRTESASWNESSLLVSMKSLDGIWKPQASFRQRTDERAPISTPAPVEVVETPVSDPTSRTLVWTTAELRSLVFPGGDGDDRHWLTLKPPSPTHVGRLEFSLPPPAELISVRMNDVRTEAQRQGDRYRLPSIPQGGLDSLVIQYRVPSDRGFLRTRQRIPVPQVEGPVLGFRWLFALPPESRLSEEPQGLRLLQPLDPTPWLRRLFGPLGREVASDWFNPFAREDWDELWNPVTESLAIDDILQEEFAPPGWRIREAVGPTLPSGVTWIAWNAHQVRVLAWVGMLFSISVGCVLRSLRARPRVLIAAFWLGLCGAGVALSAPVAAEILGGCLIGTLIAVLIPRRLVMSYTSRREASARGAFEKTVVLTGGLGVMVLGIGTVTSWPVSAQDGKASSLARSREDVLIPVDDPSRVSADNVRPSTKLPVALVSKPLWERWQAHRTRLTQPVLLLSSAEYHVETESPTTTVVAEFVVHRSRTERAAVLRWPFVSVPLAGPTACLVDGKPHPIAISSDREALLIELPAIPTTDRASSQDDTVLGPMTRHRIQLTLVPNISTEAGLARCQFPIPPIVKSRLSLKTNPGKPWVTPSHRGEVVIDAASNRRQTHLGQVSELVVEESASAVARPLADVDARIEVACLAEVLPTALRQRYRARYTVMSGELNEVSWLLPRGVLVRDADVDADNLLQWTIEPLADGRQRMNLEFSRPQTGEFTVQVAGLQPAIGTPESPQWQPWQLDSVPRTELSSTPTAKVRLRSFLLGMTCLPGFRIGPSGTSADPLPPVSDAAFAKAWGPAAPPKLPQVVFSLASPSELVFQVTPLKPLRKVRQDLLLKLGRHTIDWELHAEITTLETAAFQHDLLIPPQFRVDQVSVTEDEAERLVSWSHNDQRLTIFLRDETSGIQNVLIQGRDPLPADGRLVIPTRWLELAEASEFSVRVTHEPHWSVKIQDDREQLLNAVETGSPNLERQELSLGKFRPDPTVKSVIVQATPQAASAQAEAWTILSGANENSITATHIEHFVSGQDTPFRMVLPAEWSRIGSVRLSASLKETSRRKIQGELELTLQPVPGQTEPRVVAIDLTLSDSQRKDWTITPPSPLDWPQREHHWLIASDRQSWLSTDAELLGLDSSRTLPSVIRRWLPSGISEWLTLTPTPEALTVQSPEIPVVSSTPKTLWMETVVWVVDGSVTRGSTSLLLQPHGLRELSMRCPEAVHWLAAFVNDRPQGLEATTDRLIVRELPALPIVWITLTWEVDATHKERILARRDTRLPMPEEPRLMPERHDLTLLTVGHSDLSSTRGARRVPDWEGHLSRVRQLLTGIKRDNNLPGTVDQHLARRLVQEMEFSKQEIAQLATELRAASSAREAFKSANAELEALTVERGLPLPDSDSLLWTADHALRIPNAWNATAELDEEASLSAIVVDRTWAFWGVALLAVAALVPLVRLWLLSETGERLASHPHLAYATLGIIWWLCLSPSFLGLILLVFGVLSKLHFKQPRPPLIPPLPAKPVM